MNETIINIYNTIISPIVNSTDFLTYMLAIIAIIIAYYALLHNRPRIEITPKFGIYPLKETLRHVKLSIHNTGTNTAYNIRIKNRNENQIFFNYPKDYDLYVKLSEITTKIDKIAEKERARRINFNDKESYTKEEHEEIINLNNEIKQYKPTAKYRHPRFHTDLDSEIDNISRALDKIDERKESINNFMNMSVNVLIPTEKAICHLIDYNYTETYIAEVNLENPIDIDIFYDDIRKMDILGVFIFYLLDLILKIPLLIYKIALSKIKLKNKKIIFKIFKNIVFIEKMSNIKKHPLVEHVTMFLQMKFNIDTLQITIKRKEIKTINFKENLQAEDFMIQQRINREEYEKYIFDEFNNFLNSFKFQNWFSTLNQLEKEKMSKIIIESNNDVRNYIKKYKELKNTKYQKKTIDEKNKKFIDKYITFIKIMEDLPFLTEKYKEETTSKIIYYYELEQEEQKMKK